MEDLYLKKVRLHYKNAERSEKLGHQLIRYLCSKFSLKPEDILTANSICSDDINSMQFPHISGSLPGPFNMGGLDGFPFTGITGMTAFAHHVPHGGSLLIFYAPHIGIPFEGNPGSVLRAGQSHNSACCGAATGALPKKTVHIKDADCNSLDYQMDYIKQIFNQPENKKYILKDREQWKQVMNATDVMYDAIHKRINELVREVIRKGEFHCKYLFLLGGIFINGDAGKGSFGAYRHHRVFVNPGTPLHEEKDLLPGFFEHLKNNL